MIEDLKGKAVLITGSSTGIGAAAAVAAGGAAAGAGGSPSEHPDASTGTRGGVAGQRSRMSGTPS